MDLRPAPQEGMYIQQYKFWSKYIDWADHRLQGEHVSDILLKEHVVKQPYMSVCAHMCMCLSGVHSLEKFILQ